MNKGIISEIKEKTLVVDIQCNEACASCSENKGCLIKHLTKRIIVPQKNKEDYVVGQTVELEMTTKEMFICLLWAYILPLMIILSVLGICLAVGYSETTSALISLGSVALYYIILHFMNTKLSKSINIHIK